MNYRVGWERTAKTNKEHHSIKGASRCYTLKNALALAEEYIKDGFKVTIVPWNRKTL
jgi:hypothetical protein